MKNLSKIILGILVFFSALILFNLNITNQKEDKSEANYVFGEITKVIETKKSETEFSQKLEVQIKDNKENITIVNDESYSTHPREFNGGDKVMLAFAEEIGEYYIIDYYRTPILLILFGIFILVVVIVAGWQGLGALLGMLLSFLVIFKLILPLILNGYSPVMAAIIGSLIIIPATFYSSHGFSKKTSVAVFSTLLTLIFAGLISTLFANLGNLTGQSSEEVAFLSIETANLIDFKGLVLAGMIISILGVLDDITISQASVVRQLKSAKNNISLSELYLRSMKVGRDHISSMVNTLILVYTGASLPLLLLFMEKSQNFSKVINLEFISEEIIRTLVGSISLILAVPITTFIAVLVLSKSDCKEDGHNNRGCIH